MRVAVEPELVGPASWFSPQAASSTSRGATRRSTPAHWAISSSNSLLMPAGPPVRAAIWMVRLEPSGKVRLRAWAYADRTCGGRAGDGTRMQ